MNMKIKKSTLDLILLCATLFELCFLPHLVYIGFKYVSLAYLAIKFSRHIRKTYATLFFIILYGVAVVFSTYMNGRAINTLIASMVYILQIYVFFKVCSVYGEKKGIDELINKLFKILLCIALATDICMLFLDYNFSNPSEKYLIGSKFMVSYLHVFLSMLFVHIQESKRKSKVKSFMCIAFSLLICNKVTCTTGVLLCVLAVPFLMFPDWIKKRLISPLFIIIFVAVINILIFGSMDILQIDFVQKFVKGFLKKSYTFKGRLIIYDKIMGLIYPKLWIGYGYYSNIVADNLSFGNPQNGVLKILIDSGVFGLIGFIGIIYNSLNVRNKTIKSIKSYWPLMCYIYLIIVASSIEICLTNVLFFLSIALVYAWDNSAQVYGESNEWYLKLEKSDFYNEEI